jgi:hypothetical protein
MGVSCTTSFGIAALTAGTTGTLKAPLATTTARHCHAPSFVATRYPSACVSTEVTVVFVRTGAAMAAAYPAMKPTTSSMRM